MLVSEKRKKNPFYFKVGDKNMEKETSPQYYPPHKRKEYKDYLSKINFNIKT